MLTQYEYNKCVELAHGVYKKRLYGSDFTKKSSGLKAYIHYEEDTMYMVIAGTSIFSIKDWTTNLSILLGRKPRQFYEALEFVSQNFDPEQRLILCGHSLAGAIVTYIANNIKHNNAAAVTFNGCGARHIVDPLHIENIYHFVTVSDILNRISSKMWNGWMKHIGRIIYILDGPDLLGVKSHSNWSAFREVKLEDVGFKNKIK